MRFASLMFASVFLSAIAGASLAQTFESHGIRSAPRVETLVTGKTWLWQPAVRRVAAAY